MVRAAQQPSTVVKVRQLAAPCAGVEMPEHTEHHATTESKVAAPVPPASDHDPCGHAPLSSGDDHMQLRTDLQASQNACRALHAEAKIHREAWEAEADKSAALSARYDALQAEGIAAQARLAHLVGMLRRAEAAFYDRLTTCTFGPDAWRELYQHLLVSIQPLFMHRE